MSKILLCRPIGGLNDTLNQIERCWRYAERFDRHLLIDTKRSGLGIAFSTYFQAREDQSERAVDLNPTDASVRDLDQLECYPQEMSGRLSTYTSVASQDQTAFIDSETLTPLTFDFNRAYDQNVLLHEQAGSGSLSLDLLTRIRLVPTLRDQIEQRLSLLPQDRVAIHIRNTDLKTSYVPLLHRIASKFRTGSILVCSDDFMAVQEAKQIFGTSRVVTNSEPPDFSGRPLHHELTLSEQEKDQLNIEMLSDLFAMATSEKLFFTATQTGKVSGFSRLAWLLHQNKDFCFDFLRTAEKDQDANAARRLKLNRNLPIRVRLTRYVNKLKSLISNA